MFVFQQCYPKLFSNKTILHLVLKIISMVIEVNIMKDV